MSLIETARFWARHNSVRLALVAGTAVGWAVEHRAEVSVLLDQLPAPLPSVLAFAIFTVLPIWLRIRPQASLSKPDGQ
jgi:hypothetical protein